MVAAVGSVRGGEMAREWDQVAVVDAALPRFAATGDPYVVDHGDDLHLRRLYDGSEFRVVKVTYEPDELQALLAGHGWNAEIDATRWFIFGSTAPVPSRD